ncbi:DUF4160 domain-containing protein [Tunicatimonas pelagia]|uniref:DUF4160 domain-containing protein n=1 Tax=Tunicatimonas pelagia TaxID=931531 RepID=UPI002666377F|nr:DUF4160 domain-containing protein [Tunicatimonas pelagia]WKN40836.1 DUF4160 domain-containing protein [Tunicatimonas pelagia]
MPTVLLINGFRFFFYSDEGNEPCHIHIKKGGERGKWWLEPELKEEYAYGFTQQERKQIKRTIAEHQQQLTEAWYEYFR